MTTYHSSHQIGDINNQLSHLQCELVTDGPKKAFTISLGNGLCAEICSNWGLPINLKAWLGEVSDRILSVVDSGGARAVEWNC